MGDTGDKLIIQQKMVVISTVEQWSSFKALLKEMNVNKPDQLLLSSMDPNQVCDFTVDGCTISFHYVKLDQDMNEEVMSQATEECFKPCSDDTVTFLLLIQGGDYTEWEKRMIEIYMGHFGAEMLKYLVVLSLEDGRVVDTLDDGLLDLINLCNGRFCRITTSSANKLLALFEMLALMLTDSGATGYSENMLKEAKKMNNEEAAMKMLKKKVENAEERERDFKQMVLRHEEGRVREMEELKAKHDEERRKEAEEKKLIEHKRANLEDAVLNHLRLGQLQTRAGQDDESNKTSVIFLGLTGSGKSSALHLILERAGGQYSVNEFDHEPHFEPTLTCYSKEVQSGGRCFVMVDTPDLWDEDGAEKLEVVKDCLALSLPGPHVFLVVLQVGRFTHGESEMLGSFQKIFGRDFLDRAILLFVRFDSNQRSPQQIDDYVSRAHSSLQELVRKCGSRYYELNLAKWTSALSYPQAKELISGISKLTAAHGGQPYAGKRFSVQELRDRRTAMEDKEDTTQEVDCLLRDT